MILYIITSVAQVRYIASNDYIIKELSINNILFLTREFLIKKELEKQAFPHEYLEDYISKEEVLHCDKLICKLVMNWYMDHKKNDFTFVDGVSFGRAARSAVAYRVFNAHFFQLCLGILSYIERFDIKKIFYENSRVYRKNEGYRKDSEIVKIISGHFNIDYEVIKTTDVSIEDEKCIVRDSNKPISNSNTGMQKRNYREKLKSLFYLSLGLLKGINRKKKFNMLVSLYNPMYKYIEYTFTHGESDICYHFLSGVYKKRVLSSKHGKCMALNLTQNKYSEKSVRVSNDILEKLNTLKKNYAYLESFKLWGIDFSSYFFPKLEQIIRQMVPHYAGQTNAFRAFLEKTSIDLFFTAYDEVWYTSIMIDLCREMGIPTVELIDGGRNNLQYVSDLCDYVLCWSDLQKEYYFIRHLKRSKDSVIVTGSPLHQAYHAKFPDNTPAIVNRKDIKVLVDGLIHAGKIDVNKRAYDPDKYILEIVETLSELENISVTVRYKSQNTTEYYKWLVRNYSRTSGNVVFESTESGRFEDVIRNYDIYITLQSGTRNEAVLSGKYCVLYNSPGLPIDLYDCNKSEMMIANNPNELRAIISDIIEGEEYTREFNKIEVLEKHIGPLKDNSETIYSILKLLMLQKNLNHDN